MKLEFDVANQTILLKEGMNLGMLLDALDFMGIDIYDWTILPFYALPNYVMTYNTEITCSCK